MLAGISTDYYTRLEQGRERRPSDRVIGALADVFGLGADATAHLYALAHSDIPVHRAQRAPAGTAPWVSPHLVRLMGSWDTVPAFVMNPFMDVLAVNPLAAAFFEKCTSHELEVGDNMLRLLFLNPIERGFYRDWENAARVRVAHLRATAGRDLDDPRLTELVEELSDQSEDFCRVLARHDVWVAANDTLRLCHATVGDLTLSCDIFGVVRSPGQQLVILHAAPGTASARGLAALCREAAQRGRDAGLRTGA
ncbi:transcriptional regulator [Acrocarpospora phusangensis]|uniref:Transcriptional regulator n=2 Tax=Acrocarpospora phusangensis TaxID=1070424 RepID=A0A919QBW3_9ACTN|nr:transcriptional regulator [Acrocarpospora phusangensis]